MRLLIAIVLVSWSTLPCPSQEVQVQRDLVFARAGDSKLKLDLYLPAVKDRAPLVVFIHGGGWHKGSKDDCKLDWLVEHGYAVASISYRLTDVAIFPAQIHDCKAAVRWLRANADQFGYATDRIGVAGTSAGGMLTSLLATSGEVAALEGEIGGNLDQSSRVQAAIDFYGATDFELRSRTQPKRANEEGSVVYKLLGGGADTEVELAKLASAVTHVSEDDPPLLVFHGDNDKTVLIDQSEQIYRRYQQQGLPITWHVLAGEGHGGKAFFAGRNRERIVAFFDRWLRE